MRIADETSSPVHGLVEPNGRISITIAMLVRSPAPGAITVDVQAQLAGNGCDWYFLADVVEVRELGQGSLRYADKPSYNLRGEQQAAADTNGVQAALANPCTDRMLANAEQVSHFQQGH